MTPDEIDKRLNQLLNQFIEATGIDNVIIFANSCENSNTSLYFTFNGNILSLRQQCQDYLNTVNSGDDDYYIDDDDYGDEEDAFNI